VFVGVGLEGLEEGGDDVVNVVVVVGARRRVGLRGGGFLAVRMSWLASR
jgi:hypothetical protein